ncbi:MAG: glycosyltransferase, partial [Candidatus Cloacimonas sp.]
HSDDGSKEWLANQNNITNLKVIDFYIETPPLIGKKAAVQQGINMSRFDILAFTDADCSVPVSWLKEINRSLDEDTDYLLSYSILKRTKGGTIFRLKNFERSIYYGLASAGLYYKIPFTSSACNMIYRKKVFDESGGFDGIGHLRSGDDDLLLMKMMPHIKKGAYNPSLAMQVVSIDGSDRKKHYQTNIRRASKFKYYPWWLKALSAFVFVYFCLFYVALWQMIKNKSNKPILLSLILKTTAEFAFSQSHLRQIGRSKLGFLYPVQILIFPAQFIFYAVRGTLGKYRWK